MKVLSPVKITFQNKNSILSVIEDVAHVYNLKFNKKKFKKIDGFVTIHYTKKEIFFDKSQTPDESIYISDAISLYQEFFPEINDLVNLLISNPTNGKIIIDTFSNFVDDRIQKLKIMDYLNEYLDANSVICNKNHNIKSLFESHPKYDEFSSFLELDFINLKVGEVDFVFELNFDPKTIDLRYQLTSAYTKQAYLNTLCESLNNIFKNIEIKSGIIKSNYIIYNKGVNITFNSVYELNEYLHGIYLKIEDDLEIIVDHLRALNKIKESREYIDSLNLNLDI